MLTGLQLWGRSLLTVSLLCVACASASAEDSAANGNANSADNAAGRGSEWLDESTPLGDEVLPPVADAAVGNDVAAKLTKNDGTPLSLGFVNLRRVMASIPQLASLRTRLDSEFAQQKALLDQQANEIQQLENKLATMPRGDAYSEFEKEVIAKRRTFARLDSSFRDAYSVRRNEELAALQQLVVDEIVGLAKEEGYDVILNDTGVIFVSSNADLSQMVIARLQKLAQRKVSDAGAQKQESSSE